MVLAQVFFPGLDVISSKSCVKTISETLSWLSGRVPSVIWFNGKRTRKSERLLIKSFNIFKMYLSASSCQSNPLENKSIKCSCCKFQWLHKFRNAAFEPIIHSKSSPSSHKSDLNLVSLLCFCAFECTKTHQVYYQIQLKTSAVLSTLSVFFISLSLFCSFRSEDALFCLCGPGGRRLWGVAERIQSCQHWT